MNLYKSMFGSGIYALPFAVFGSGIALAPLVMLAVAVFAIWGMAALVKTRRRLHDSGAQTYGDVAGLSFGRAGTISVNLFLALTQLGFCLVYVVLLLSTAQHELSSIPFFTTMGGRALLCLIMFPILASLSLIRSLKRLAPLSGVANLILASIFVCVWVCSGIAVAQRDGQPAPGLRPFGSIGGVATAFAVATYAFEGIAVILPIETSAHNPHQFPPLLIGSMSAVVVVFLAMGITAAACFGSETAPIVLQNIQFFWLRLLCEVLMLICILFTFPVSLYPITSSMIEGEFFHLGPWLSGESWRVIGIRCSIRLSIVVCLSVLGIFATNITAVIGLVGAACSTALAYIIPCLSHLRVCGPRECPVQAGSIQGPHSWTLQSTRTELVMDAITICIGVVGGVVGVIVSVQKLSS